MEWASHPLHVGDLLDGLQMIEKGLVGGPRDLVWTHPHRFPRTTHLDLWRDDNQKPHQGLRPWKGLSDVSHEVHERRESRVESVPKLAIPAVAK